MKAPTEKQRLTKERVKLRRQISARVKRVAKAEADIAFARKTALILQKELAVVEHRLKNL